MAVTLQEQLSRRMEELQAERSKTEAHIQSLKKRKADLSVSMRLEALKTQNSYYTHKTIKGMAANRLTIYTKSFVWIRHSSLFSCFSLKRSTDVMKQQVREHFESMQLALKQDEQAVLDSLELDLRRTRTRLDQVLQNWKQHQDQVIKNMSSIQTALSKTPKDEEGEKV